MLFQNLAGERVDFDLPAALHASLLKGQIKPPNASKQRPKS
jgi:hypothetical protein